MTGLTSQLPAIIWYEISGKLNEMKFSSFILDKIIVWIVWFKKKHMRIYKLFMAISMHFTVYRYVDNIGNDIVIKRVV